MLFICEECKKEFKREDFTQYYVCKFCYDIYWQQYCDWVEEQYRLREANKIQYEEYQYEAN